MAFPELGKSEMTPEGPEKDSREIGETKAETRESPEASRRVEQATFEPEAVVEREGNYRQAEAIETAFMNVVEAPILEAASRQPNPGGESGASIVHPERVAAAKVPTAGNLDGSSSEPELAWREEGYRNAEGDNQLKSDEAVDTLEPGVGMADDMRGEALGYQGDASQMGFEDPGGGLAGFPGPMGDSLGGPMGGIPDPLEGGRGGPDGIPDLIGQPDEPWNDMPDLAGSGMPGADPTISEGGQPGPHLGGEAGPALQEFEHQINLQTLGAGDPADVANSAAAAQREEADGFGNTYWAEVQKNIGNQMGNEDGGDVAGDGTSGGGTSGGGTSGDGTSGGGSSDVGTSSGGSDGGGSDGGDTPEDDADSTPNPEGFERNVANPVGDDPISTYLWGLMHTDDRGQPTVDPVDSVGQPVGEEGGSGVNHSDRPLPPISLEQAMADHVDPHINWGDGFASSGNQGGFSAGGGSSEVEPVENTLIDPQDMPGGGEGGYENPDRP